MKFQIIRDTEVEIEDNNDEATQPVSSSDTLASTTPCQEEPSAETKSADDHTSTQTGNIPSLRVRATVLKEGQSYELPMFSDGVWQCPFCEEGKVLFIDETQAKNHIHNEHAKKQFRHKGMSTASCSFVKKLSTTYLSESKISLEKESC